MISVRWINASAFGQWGSGKSGISGILGKILLG
jgi:hypothetical protein